MNNSAVDTNYHLFYGFNDPEGQSIALTAISVVKPILNRKELFLFDKTSRTTGYSGMVSARQLHFICGPYPELHIENNILFDKVVQTGIMPVLLMMLIVLSSLTFAVLTRSTMQTPVYAVLLGITIAEMSNGLLPLPMYLLRAFYGESVWWENRKYSRNNLTQISKWWKYAPLHIYETSSNPTVSGILAWTTVFLPTVCHTTATWLTLFVAFQRLIYITYPNKASRLFSIPIVRCVCVLVFTCALLLHIPMFQSTFTNFQPLLLHQNLTLRNYSVNFKEILLYEALDHLPEVVMKCHLCLPIQMFLYFLSRVILVHLLPCILLIILTIMIIIRMRRIHERHLWLTKGRVQVQLSKMPISYERIKSHSLPNCFRLGVSPNINNISSDGYTHNTEHRQNTNEDEIKSKINCFCCITTSKLHAFLFTNQNDGNFHTNLHKNISLDAIDNNDDNQIQNKGFNVAAVRRKSQVTELFCVSNMLIVLLIKFILIHLPIALVIFIYTIKLMQNRIYGRPTSTHSNGVVQEFIPIIRSSNHTILLPYTVMELVSELDRVNAAINVSEAHTNIIWLRVVTICNLLILCSYLLNFLVFWTMSTQFRTQFRNLFQCRWIKRLCSKK
ncbi:unnamed protein product [Heterobilharzia americana]|nr:unnamed protein product [Heterobilharzia americana]